MFKNPFSFEGRIRRLEYCISNAIYFFVLFLFSLSFIFAFELIGAGVVLFLGVFICVYIVMLWFMLAQNAKRCHDRGNSGWYQIIPFYFLFMLFGDGDDFDNGYGSDPKGRNRCSSMFMSYNVSAQVYKYQTTSFSYTSINSMGYWNKWSDWEAASMLIVINLNNNKIDVYSRTPQHYDIIEFGNKESDNQGGESYILQCVDGQGVRCNIRTRTLNDGQMQLYVYYNYTSWGYNIYRKN